MSNYIGNQPSQGEFKRLDAIASSFDGSTTQFNLTYNSVSQTAGDASQLIVSLNGIIQEPLEAYTLGIGGNSLIFASAPASGDTCHIVLLGGVGQSTTPTDGSVTASKLDAALKDYYEDEFTASGGTDYTLSREAIGVNQLMVTIDGIVQPTSAYSASGTTLTISPALPTGTNIRVVHMGVKAGVYVPQAGSVGLNELDVTALDNRYYQSGDSISVGTIDATGNVAIEKSANTLLTVTETGAGAVSIQGTGSGGRVYSNASNKLLLGANGQNSHIAIDTAGNVGIGTVSPDGKLNVFSASAGSVNADTDADELVLENSGNVGLSLLTDNAGESGIYFGNPGTNGQKDFYLKFYHESHATTANRRAFTFNTSSTERMRIDSSGNLLVGKTSADYGASVGFEANSNDTVYSTRSGGAALTLNRTTSGGDIAIFRKDGATVGSIGNDSTELYINMSSTNNSGIASGISGGIPVIFPTGSNGAVRDNAITLGYNTGRWKDLYLSGGVYLGGTTSTNYLDDYEEGTYDVVCTMGSGSAPLNTAIDKARYIKVGNLVTIYGQVQFGAVSSPSGQCLFTIPFTANVNGGEGSMFATGPVRLYNQSYPSGCTYVICHLDDSTHLTIRGVRDGASTVELTPNTNGYVMFSLTYLAA